MSATVSGTCPQQDRDRSRQRIEDLNERVSELEQDLGSLALINRALLATLREQPSWNEDIFKQTVYDLDLEDGSSMAARV